MCDNVFIHGTVPRVATRQGELAEIIGRENVVMDEGGVSPAGGFFEEAEFCRTDCLCPVNLPATASKVGYQQSRIDAEGEHDPFDVHWRKEPRKNNLVNLAL